MLIQPPRPAIARCTFYPGDLVLFAGHNWESRAIALATCSPAQLLLGQWFSHVAICADYRGRVLLFESTTLCDLPCEIRRCKVHGPQAHDPRLRVHSYAGSVWRMRLSRDKRLCDDERQSLTASLTGKLGEGYDYEGAAICGTRLLRLARWIRPSLDRLFCSRYCMSALKAIDVVDHDLNPAVYSPARMARDLQWWGTYQWLAAAGSESLRIK
ncbi:MAG TPA: hypothetical protein VFI31_00775 [Pirellulales bacterium]|nr:hypothetical protein [Pirellulales bacterium]